MLNIMTYCNYFDPEIIPKMSRYPVDILTLHSGRVFYLLHGVQLWLTFGQQITENTPLFHPLSLILLLVQKKLETPY